MLYLLDGDALTAIECHKVERSGVKWFL